MEEHNETPLQVVDPATMQGYIKKGNAKDATYYLIQKGLSPTVATGIVGSMMQESTPFLDPGIEEKGGGGGYGIAQWTGKRREALEAYAEDRGQPVSNFELQMDFLWDELTETKYRKYDTDSGKLSKPYRYLDTMYHLDTPGDVASMFNRTVERSGEKSGSPRDVNRREYAAELYDEISAPSLAEYMDYNKNMSRGKKVPVDILSEYEDFTNNFNSKDINLLIDGLKEPLDEIDSTKWKKAKKAAYNDKVEGIRNQVKENKNSTSHEFPFD